MENIIEVTRKIRYRYRTHPNPKNASTASPGQYASYLKFAFVRNPWARAYSWYRNVIRDEDHRRRYRFRGDTPFRDFLERFAGTWALRPQTHYLREFNGEVSLDFIGRFEKLQEGFDTVCEMLGTEKKTLPHRMEGAGADYRNAYDSRTRDLVARVFREEIELFDYSSSWPIPEK